MILLHFSTISLEMSMFYFSHFQSFIIKKNKGIRHQLVSSMIYSLQILQTSVFILDPVCTVPWWLAADPYQDFYPLCSSYFGSQREHGGAYSRAEFTVQCMGSRFYTVALPKGNIQSIQSTRSGHCSITGRIQSKNQQAACFLYPGSSCRYVVTKMNKSVHRSSGPKPGKQEGCNRKVIQGLIHAPNR